ncbi:serine/threonine protein kinase [Bdellovibrio sp. SKB1291214]|uniref:serine/threonine protein kinase n=1 Tax=Bdellovibrio sp. SKB1291214 TaxID=1732569 RepID=UPI000B51E0D0|nr:serine/threonine-protein kinase [Bdellovibrio sp. SKB1291214]UYL09047.1 serine/threonine protein kinase [Bdellovibrio sp. SKB1291214]
MTTQKRIGPFQIIKRIAEGGMAEVYLGKSESRFGVSKLVAIKTTLPVGQTDEKNAEIFKEMFFKEIRVSANLNHQNIVKIYDFGEHESRAYMVMEYIHGVTLRDLMAYHREIEKPLNTAFILYIIHQVALALGYAFHSVDPQTGSKLKLIHRDISPHNILISFEGEVKIIDFGIAKASRDKELTQLGLVKGKVAYMSPEQIKHEDLDQRTDIFSLGIVFWELLSNMRFFAASTVGEIKNAIKLYDVAHLSTSAIKDRSPELRNLLTKMLNQNPERRIDDANDVARLVGTLLSVKHPDFSALAFAEYLKDVFAVTYKDTMAEIKKFVLEDDQTMTISTTATAEEVMSMLTHETESGTKTGTGTGNTALTLRGITVPPLPVTLNPPPPPKVDPSTWENPQPIIRNFGKPQPQAPNIKFGNALMGALGIAVVLTVGLLLGKSNLEGQKVAAKNQVQVPTLTPIQVRRPAQQQMVLPAPPSPFKKPPTVTKRMPKKKRYPAATRTQDITTSTPAPVKK